MTELIFRKMGLRRPTSHKSLQEVLSYIDKTELENQVVIDLRGCVFSYPLAQILEKIVIKIASLDGEKQVTIIHAYSTAFEEHLTPYLTKKVSYIPSGINTLEELKKNLLEMHQVTLNISEEQREQ